MRACPTRCVHPAGVHRTSDGSLMQILIVFIKRRRMFHHTWYQLLGLRAPTLIIKGCQWSPRAVDLLLYNTPSRRLQRCKPHSPSPSRASTSRSNSASVMDVPSCETLRYVPFFTSVIVTSSNLVRGSSRFTIGSASALSACGSFTLILGEMN